MNTVQTTTDPKVSRQVQRGGSFNLRLRFSASVQNQLRLAESRSGRIWLHLICALSDHKFTWHWYGIRRELRWSSV